MTDPPLGVLGNPGFYVTYAVLQAVLVLIVIRAVDRYEREPWAALLVVAAWGATGAAAIALAANDSLRGLLTGNAQLVFGDAIFPPVFEEFAKGLALVVAVAGSRWASRRVRIPRFEGLTDGLVYGAAVGLGFGFTEDFFYFLGRVQEQGLSAGAHLFVARRDFFGPVALHHPLFTAAFGAGLGLGAWSRTRRGRLGFPALGLAVAVLMHAVNNGAVELLITLTHGLAAAAAWMQNQPVAPAVSSLGDAASGALAVVDYLYIGLFALAAWRWNVYQRRVIGRTLDGEVAAGLISADERDVVLASRRRSSLYWRLFRERRLERLQHLRRLHRAIVDLALLEWRTARFGGEPEWIRAARRRVVALQGAAAGAGNVPERRSGLVGRAKEVEELLALLRSPDVRLLTLTGPGGTGKTRLSLETAAVLRDELPSGAFVVELAAVRDPAGVAPAIAEVLEVREVVGEPLLRRLQDHLRDKCLLLVFDNFEQVRGGGPVVGELLAAAPRVTALVTSRVPLRVQGEREYPVPPLGLPADDDADPTSVGGSEAVRLFLERGRAVAPELAVTESNATAIAEICRRLDGLPLALELAASRVKLLPPEAMARWLEQRLALPDSGSTDRPERQRTLQGAIAWSEDLLPRSTRELFHQLAVFSGGFDLEAASAVCGRDGDEADLLAEIATLVDASLVRAEDDAAGGARYSMLETIREHALARLRESGTDLAVAQRHAEHFAALAETAEPLLRSSEQSRSAARLERDHDNLAAALAWLAQTGRIERLLSASVALARFWERGHLGEGRRWLSLGLEQGGRPVRDDLRARAQYGVGRLALLQGDFGEAEESLAAADERFRALADREGLVASLWDLGWVLLVRGDYAGAESLFGEDLELARARSDEPGIARALTGLGRAQAEQGRLDTAESVALEGLELRRRLGDGRAIANSLTAVGRIAMLAGEPTRARLRLEEALTIARGLGDSLRAAEALYGLTLLELEAGDRDRASAIARERLALCRDLGDKLGVAECLECLALATVGGGRAERAARLMGAAAAMRESIGAQPWEVERKRYEPYAAKARSALGADHYKEAHDAGARMSLDEAVGLALKEEVTERSVEPLALLT